MAIGTPVSRGNVNGATSATTASFTPNANTFLLAKGCSKSTTTPPAPSITDSLGGTWTKVGDIIGPNSSVFIVGALWRRAVGGSPASMTVSANSGQTVTELEVVEVSGISSDFSNIGTGLDSAGDPSCTLASGPASSSAVISFGCGHLTNVFSVTGFTKLYDATNGSNFRCSCAYILPTGALATAPWSSSNTNSASIIVELKDGTIVPTDTSKFLQMF